MVSALDADGDGKTSTTDLNVFGEYITNSFTLTEAQKKAMKFYLPFQLLCKLGVPKANSVWLSLT